MLTRAKRRAALTPEVLSERSAARSSCSFSAEASGTAILVSRQVHVLLLPAPQPSTLPVRPDVLALRMGATPAGILPLAAQWHRADRHRFERRWPAYSRTLNHRLSADSGPRAVQRRRHALLLRGKPPSDVQDRRRFQARRRLSLFWPSRQPATRRSSATRNALGHPGAGPDARTSHARTDAAGAFCGPRRGIARPAGPPTGTSPRRHAGPARILESPAWTRHRAARRANCVQPPAIREHIS